MAEKSNDSLINRLRIFSRNLPETRVIFVMLILVSIITGLLSTSIISYQRSPLDLGFVAASGVLAGILIVLLPTLLTVAVIKYFRRYATVKHLLFLSLLGALAYSLFLIIASLAYILTKNYSLSGAIVLVGDASIFGWWFFLSKIVLGQRKKAVLFSLAQPTLNMVFYIISSSFVFTFAYIPAGVVFAKLYAGIFIFLIISYIILYVLDSPVKRGLGFDSIDVFSSFVQNWLYDIDLGVGASFKGEKFGVHSDVEVQTVVFKNRSGRIKVIVFAPWIHYGPMGSLGGSNFPYMIEKYASSKYDAPTVVMHCAVDEGSNPVSSSQFGAIRRALDLGVVGARKTSGSKSVARYSRTAYGDAVVRSLGIGGISLVTLSRAPKVTEDVAPEAARLFRELLNNNIGENLLVDAHNSRYETAPADELRAVTLSSKAMDQYLYCIEHMEKPEHRSRKLVLGVGSIDAYSALGAPDDMAPGNLNVLLFTFNGFKHATIHINANNMLPQLRERIVRHVKDAFGVDAEVYTTDTHFVNSLHLPASNVLGRYADAERLMEVVDRGMHQALGNAEEVDAYYKKDYMKNFYVWGPNIRERVFPVINSTMGLARTLVPAIIVIGFVIGAWIISYV